MGAAAAAALLVVFIPTCSIPPSTYGMRGFTSSRVHVAASTSQFCFLLFAFFTSELTYYFYSPCYYSCKKLLQQQTVVVIDTTKHAMPCTFFPGVVWSFYYCMVFYLPVAVDVVAFFFVHEALCNKVPSINREKSFFFIPVHSRPCARPPMDHGRHLFFTPVSRALFLFHRFSIAFRLVPCRRSTHHQQVPKRHSITAVR